MQFYSADSSNISPARNYQHLVGRYSHRTFLAQLMVGVRVADRQMIRDVNNVQNVLRHLLCHPLHLDQ
jgi:hypothetical protein